MTYEQVKKKLTNMDFLKHADNVYRTKEFIVRQCVTFCVDDEGNSHILS